jgi:flavorubredoxin/drug/metabolite transporter (DMT)-like permease
MKPRQIVPNVHLIGAIDWDRRLFDALIPLPDGTSYNAYFIEGSEKNVLLDTVDPAMWQVLEAQLDQLPAPDYLVVHHVEQDHSGSTPLVLERCPDATIVCNEKAKNLLVDHLHVDDARFHVVADGDTLALGDKTLTFLSTPWVHWPETMSTWLEEDGILFSCDFFGSHLATTDLFADKHEVYDGAKRYYAEIMMPFGPQVTKNIDKVTQYPIRYIAPSHGPVYDDPAFIVDAYRDWAGGEPRNIVCLPYVTMHDSTRLMVDHLTAALADRGVAVERFDLTTVDAGELASSLVHAGTVVIGSPTVLTGPHPLAANAAVRRERPAAAHEVRDRDRLVRLGRQDGGDPGGPDAKLKVELLDPVLARACRAKATSRRSTPWPTPSPRSTRISQRACDANRRRPASPRRHPGPPSAVLTIISGLLTSLSYATSDMLSQNVTRHTRPLTQMAWVLATGVALVVPVALLARGLPDDGEWQGAGLAALAGAIYFFALFCLLQGLRSGDLGLISALTSLQGAYVAVAVVVLGAPITPLLGAALGLCATGAVLTSFEGRARSTRGAPWAFAAGMLFAGVMLCYAYGDIDWLSQAAISRTVSFTIALPVALLTGGAAVPARLRPRAVGAGVLELAGVLLLTITFAMGPATVAGVTTTQFGTFAVLLGLILLHERPRPNQWVGIGATILGVSLLAASL